MSSRVNPMFLTHVRVEHIVIVRARTGLVPILPDAGRQTKPNFVPLHVVECQVLLHSSRHVDRYFIYCGALLGGKLPRLRLSWYGIPLRKHLSIHQQVYEWSVMEQHPIK